MQMNKPTFWCYLLEIIRGTKGYYCCHRTGETYIEKTKSPRPDIVNSFINIIIGAVSVFVTGILMSLLLSNTNVSFKHIGLFACIIFAVVFVISLTGYWFIQFNKTTFVKKEEDKAILHPLDIKNDSGLY